jgi:hypothetical protein
VDKVLFVQIAKIDVEKREVWGQAVQEVPDKSREIFDYQTSAPLFRDWSAGFEKATDGKSLGNIRAMHGKVAAGKVIAIDFNDDSKAIDIGTKIVDDGDWQKCLEGVYTGFSIGGEYVKKWKDGDFTRYTARPSEISLVDNPCVPTAKFTMVKADGATEEMEFKAPAAPAPDPAATGGQTEKSAAATETDPAVEPVVSGSSTAAPPEVKKSLYGVATLASLLSSAASEARMAQWEADSEDDNSPVPAQLRAWLASGLQILNAMAAEESAELVADLASDAGVIIELADSGTLHKLAANGPGRVVLKVDVAGLSQATESLAKAAADLTKMTTERDALQKRVEELEKEPAPAQGRSESGRQRTRRRRPGRERRARGQVPARTHEESASQSHTHQAVTTPPENRDDRRHQQVPRAREDRAERAGRAALQGHHAGDGTRHVRPAGARTLTDPGDYAAAQHDATRQGQRRHRRQLEGDHRDQRVARFRRRLGRKPRPGDRDHRHQLPGDLRRYRSRRLRFVRSRLRGRRVQDAKAVAALNLLRSVMIQEEQIILGGNATLALGTTGTPTLVASASGGTIGASITVSVICVALTLDGYKRSLGGRRFRSDRWPSSTPTARPTTSASAPARSRRPHRSRSLPARPTASQGHCRRQERRGLLRLVRRHRRQRAVLRPLDDQLDRDHLAAWRFAARVRAAGV